jgi:hypothetical protein
VRAELGTQIVKDSQHKRVNRRRTAVQTFSSTKRSQRISGSRSGAAAVKARNERRQEAKAGRFARATADVETLRDRLTASIESPLVSADAEDCFAIIRRLDQIADAENNAPFCRMIRAQSAALKATILGIGVTFGSKGVEFR